MALATVRNNVNTFRNNLGSVGACWPPRLDRGKVLGRKGTIHERGNDRLKGFADVLVDKNNAFSILRNVRDEGNHQEVTRITLRALVRHQDLSTICRNTASECGFLIEAIIPLGPRYDNTFIVYFGCNSSDRTVSDDIGEQQTAEIKIASVRKPLSSGELFASVNSNGYAIDREIDTANGDMDRLVKLYQECLPLYFVELDRNNLISILTNSENSVVVIRDNGTIVSAAVAEHATIQVGDITLPLVELSECATDPEYRRRGLVSATLHSLILSLTPETIIYSEARAPHLPINVALRKNSLSYCGTLPKHCIIGGAESLEGNNGFMDMEGLNVWSMVMQ
ncbi:MAG: GNAT family N-acetyltransferase [Candidatus Micrarchaeota archaeon]